MELESFYLDSPVPLFRGSSRFENLIVSQHSRFTCECNKEDINDDDDDDRDDDDDDDSPARNSPANTLG